MSNFIVLTKEKFEEILPNNFLVVEDSKCKEIIYELDTKNSDINVRVYSTVDIRTNETRGLGQDAIRIVFWDTKNDRPIGKGKKILRVEGKTTIQERIKNRITEFMTTAYDQQIIDFEYVKAILNSSAVNWMDFSQSLLENLESYGSLSDKQLSYVLGDVNPNGKITFEARAKNNDPDFLNKYLSKLEEDENGNEKRETELPNKSIKKKDESQTQTSAVDQAVEGVLGIESITRVIEVELKWVNTKNYAGYQYPFEKFNPVQTAVLPHIEEDNNMVIGSSTGSGKTIAAELIIDTILNPN